MTFLESLRAANMARNALWDPNNKFTTMFWACELGGEAGEACNLLKKLEREELGAVGSRANPLSLKEELADVIICCDLLAMNQNIILPEAALPTFPKLDQVRSYALLGATLVSHAGKCCALVVNGNRAPMQLLPAAIADTMAYSKQIGDWLGFNMYEAVATKFNMTSDKVGLDVHLEI